MYAESQIELHTDPTKDKISKRVILTNGKVHYKQKLPILRGTYGLW